MAHIDSPRLFVEGALELDVYRGRHDPSRWHVDVVDVNSHRRVLGFTGHLEDLHGLFLGLHNVLVDAGRTGTGQLILPGRAQVDEVLAEAEDLADGEGEGEGEG